MSQFDTNKLTTMSKNAPDLSAGLATNISDLNDVIGEYTEQRDAIQNGVCGVAKTAAIAFITTTVLVLYPGGYIEYGSGFGTIAWSDPGPAGNISAWSIKQFAIPTPITVYSYSRGDFPPLDVYVDDYAYGNDLITRPLTSGATYGLTPNISTLSNGKSILQANKSKLDAMPDVLNRYAT